MNCTNQSYQFHQTAALYKNQLFTIMEDWAQHTLDTENGGYLTNFDEYWNLTRSTKNVWAQARQSYMFSAFYICMDANPRWLHIAKAGRDFLVNHAYAGNGRWNHELDGTGTIVLEGTTTVFSDLFCLSALSQYAVASKDMQDLPLIRETFESIRCNILNPNFRDIAPHSWQAGIQRHSPYMIAINACKVAGQVLGEETVRPFIDVCINKLLYFFSQNSSGYLLESLCENGQILDTCEGRIVNPGHIFEGMWFCMDDLYSRHDFVRLQRALEIVDTTCTRAFDPQYGGILHRFDCFNKQTITELPTDTGILLPDSKVDWVHCEALYCFALSAACSGSKDAWDRFWELHNYCQSHFVPPDSGDWYPLLAADGTILRKNKGGKHRVAFHVPRALMNLTILFSKLSEQPL